MDKSGDRLVTFMMSVSSNLNIPESYKCITTVVIKGMGKKILYFKNNKFYILLMLIE